MIKKAIILAAGSGSRLNPLTKAINKCLLPVYDKPMIFWPLFNLLKMGIQEICIVSDIENIGNYVKVLNNGSDFNVNINYVIQKEKNGVAGALKETKVWANNEPIAVILGDGYFEDSFYEDIKNFKSGAKVFLKKVDNPESYGCAILSNDSKITTIIEKPVGITSGHAVTGLYFYDSSVWSLLNEIKKSRRNEYEITDLNNLFLRDEKLDFRILDGFWSDLGTSIEEYCNLQVKIRSILRKQ